MTISELPSYCEVQPGRPTDLKRQQPTQTTARPPVPQPPPRERNQTPTDDDETARREPCPSPSSAAAAGAAAPAPASLPGRRRVSAPPPVRLPAFAPARRPRPPHGRESGDPWPSSPSRPTPPWNLDRARDAAQPGRSPRLALWPPPRSLRLSNSRRGWGWRVVVVWRPIPDGVVVW